MKTTEKHKKWRKKYYDGLPGSIITVNNSKKLYIKIKNKFYRTQLDADFEQHWQMAYNLKKMKFLNTTINPNLVNPFEKQAKMTIFEAYKEFSEHHYPKISERTIKSYELAFNRIFPTDRKLTKENIETALLMFDRADVEFSLSKYNQTKGKLSQTSKNIYYTSISPYLKYIEKYIGKIDLSNFKRKAQQKVKKDYTKDEINKLLEYFDDKDKEFANLLRFMLMTGGRISETLNTTWENIKDDRVVFYNKIDKIEETVPISKRLQEIIDEQKELVKERQDNKQQVFRWQAISSSKLRKKLDKAMEDCNIEKNGRSFHELRKTFKSLLKQSGIGIEDAHVLMRHRNIATTQKFYAVENSEEIRKAFKKVNIDF